MYPQGIQTPDYLINGERFDLKTFKSSGKNVFYNMIAKKKKQSPNFIFDITECPLSAEEIERQINGLYSSHHTRFIEKIVVMKDGKIEKTIYPSGQPLIEWDNGDGKWSFLNCFIPFF